MVVSGITPIINYFTKCSVLRLVTYFLIDEFIRYVLHVIHVKKNMITVRGVDEEVLRKFKATITVDKMKMGQALTKAMKYWIKQKERSEKIDSSPLFKIKPFDWGRGTEKTSKEIDDIVYLRK